MTQSYPGQFRLARVQLINWGTFHGYYSIPVSREGFLITGGSGSGKSTLLDAISAVLVPHGSLNFNAASQQESGRSNGRSLVSYIRGAWRTLENPQTGDITSSNLRDGATYSIVALTYDNGNSTVHTLVAIFRLDGGESSNADIKKLFGIIPGDVDINELTPLLTRSLDTRKIKARFAGTTATFTQTYSTFADRFRRRLGINNVEAQMLLHRTQSAKSLGSLDQLFRDFMLDKPTTFDRANEAVEQFDDLRQAYLKVEDVNAQIEALAPLPAHNDRRKEALAAREKADAMLTALPTVCRRVRADALDEEIRRHTANLSEAEARLAELSEQLEHRQSEERRAADVVNERTSNAVEMLQLRIEREQQQITHRQSVFARIAEAATGWELNFGQSAEGFAALQASAQVRLDDFETDKAKLNDESRQLSVESEQATQNLSTIEADLASLSGRRSNINRELLELRQRLCHDTNFTESELPFAGELMDVSPDHNDWEPVIQKLLHNFAGTLLVPSAAREKVNAWVNSHNVKARLEYRAVPETTTSAVRSRDPRLLIHKLEFQDHPMSGWIQNFISRRFNYVCVADLKELEALSPETRGVTQEGLERHPRDKDGSTRFIKDDRTSRQGTRFYRIGSTNQAKIELLQQERVAAKSQCDATRRRLEETDRKLDDLRTERERAQVILATSFQDIDATPAQRRKADLEEELKQLNSSPETAEILAAHERAKAALEAAHTEHSEAFKEHSQIEWKLGDLRKQRADIDPSSLGGLDPEIGDAVHQALTKTTRRLTLSNIGDRRDAVQEMLQKKAKEADTTATRAAGSISSLLSNYLQKWPSEGADLKAEPDYAGEGIRKLEYLRADRLGEFRAQFLDLLNGTTVDNLSHLATLLRRAKSEIETRMEYINKSLSRSPFNPGRTLRIDVKDARGSQVIEFQRYLDAATSGAFEEATADAHEAGVARYHALDKILTRLGSSAPEDGRWRNVVLDTRRHVSFIGRELNADGDTVNTYQDSAALSGGQAQKLVFFCLAAALRYRLADIDAELPTYGTVILDEAFDRADPEFTRTAMDVFTSFGFHMVLATPFKLIRTLSPYVDGTIVVNYEETVIDGKPSARSGFALIDAAGTSTTDDKEDQHADAQ